MSSVYTVTQINAYIKNMFSQDFLLSRVYIKGEISNCKYHSSGHIYFTLKDEGAAIACVMFSGYRKGLSFQLMDGQKVIVFGGINIYEKSGTYQLYANEIRLDGLGELYVRYEALKRELEEMGMFDPCYKQPIPKYISTLGVVTAPTGAAVRDIINVSRRRNPGIRILLYPAKVQGEGAAQSVAAGIAALANAGVDTIIIGRGGGSIEDLWAFNEELTVRAVFDCPVPIISAVGHETDTVITDYAADLRAPTPSAAAELAVADVRQLLMTFGQYEERLTGEMLGLIDSRRERLERCRIRLSALSPAGALRMKQQRLKQCREMLQALMRQHLSAARGELEVYREMLRGASPYEKLEQGYAFVTRAAQETPGKAQKQGKKERRIFRASQVEEGALLKIYFSDGCVSAIARTPKAVENGGKAPNEITRAPETVGSSGKAPDEITRA